MQKVQNYCFFTDCPNRHAMTNFEVLIESTTHGVTETNTFRESMEMSVPFSFALYIALPTSKPPVECHIQIGSLIYSEVIYDIESKDRYCYMEKDIDNAGTYFIIIKLNYVANITGSRNFTMYGYSGRPFCLPLVFHIYLVKFTHPLDLPT